MQRTPVNPWPWSLPLGYNQAEVVTGATRHLVIAGQTAVDAKGHPQHPGDMRGQLALTLDNLDAVLRAEIGKWTKVVKAAGIKPE